MVRDGAYAPPRHEGLICSRRPGTAKALLVGPDIGLGRWLEVASGQLDQFVAARGAQRLDHVEMVAACAIERFRKRIRIGTDAVDLLCQEIDGLDQAGIAAQAE